MKEKEHFMGRFDALSSTQMMNHIGGNLNGPWAGNWVGCHHTTKLSRTTSATTITAAHCAVPMRSLLITDRLPRLRKLGSQMVELSLRQGQDRSCPWLQGVPKRGSLLAPKVSCPFPLAPPTFVRALLYGEATIDKQRRF